MDQNSESLSFFLEFLEILTLRNVFFTSRKAGQHVLQVQGEVESFSFLLEKFLILRK